MPVDLHLHSTFSDGTDAPGSIVSQAAAAGLSTIALTDHDNLNGIEEARAAAAAAGVDLISGTELSVLWSGRPLHLLVYFLEPEPGPLQDRLAGLQASRADRNLRMTERLQQLGMDVTYDEIDMEANGEGIGRPHFAAVLVRKGYARDIPDAFDRFLAVGRPAYLGRDRLELHEAIALAKASRAAPVVAHPHTITPAAEDYAATFFELVDAGIAGIESYYGEYEPALRDHLALLCRQLGVVATGGSDYHGAYKPDLAVGTGRGDLVVPDHVVSELLATIA